MTTKMKVFAIVFTVCIIGVFANTADREKFLADRDACIAENNIERSVLDKVKIGEWEMDNRKFQCFMKCLMMKTNVMKDDGTFDKEEVANKIKDDYSAEKVLEIIDKCTTSSISDPCEKALKAVKCFTEYAAVSVQGL